MRTENINHFKFTLTSNMHKMIRYFKQNSRRLVFMDAGGALLSACLLLILSFNFSDHIGIPQSSLNVLALIAFLIFCYSLLSGLIKNIVTGKTLLSIAIINIFYCLLTLAALFRFGATITSLGIMYFGLEILIIVILISMEIKVAAET